MVQLFHDFKSSIFSICLGPRVQYENTYRMDPEKKVNLVQVKEIILGVLEEKFGDMTYNAVDASLLCKRASQQIKESVKKLDFERYKLVCVVTVSSQERQGIKQASRFLWDDKKDNWIDATYTNASLIANASLYALYYE